MCFIQCTFIYIYMYLYMYMYIYVHINTVHIHVIIPKQTQVTCILGEGSEGLTGVPGCLGEAPGESGTVGRLPGRLWGCEPDRGEEELMMCSFIHTVDRVIFIVKIFCGWIKFTINI